MVVRPSWVPTETPVDADIVGNDLVTQNFGVKFTPYRRTEIGVAYEVPLTGFKDVIDSRLMVDLILRY